MEITPDKQILFSGSQDYAFLRALRFDMIIPRFCNDAIWIQAILGDYTESQVFRGRLSKNELEETLAQQDFESLGKDYKGYADSTLIELVACEQRAQEKGIIYSLPPKWLAPVFLETAELFNTQLQNRDHLLSLMIDGLNPLDLAEIEGQNRQPGEWIEPDYALEMDIDAAQARHDLSKYAAEIAKVINRALNLD